MSEQPIFSKKAERRVKDRLPIPTSCPHCAGTVAFASNSEVYRRAYGEWPWIYLCQAESCRAYVGTHPETNLPLGTLATAAMRAARKAAKEQFNALWQGGRMSRTDAYAWLAGALNIPVSACHFGWFNEAQCARALQALAAERQPRVRTQTAVKAFADLRAILTAGPAPR
jgi:hypothetical protein